MKLYAVVASAWKFGVCQKSSNSVPVETCCMGRLNPTDFGQAGFGQKRPDKANLDRIDDNCGAPQNRPADAYSYSGDGEDCRIFEDV